MPTTVRTPYYFTVPAGTKARACKKCPALIFDVRTATSIMPIRCDVEGGIAPTQAEPGRGLSHFADCVAAAEFRRPHR